MPKVSFILPAYKRRFLREAIASILAQTYRDFELVVVDDSSPEDLKSVVDEFHDERLTYHRNETNIGGKDLVAAWNKALGYANGEWVVLASDDDVYSPRYVEEMIRLSEKYPDVDLLHCRIVAIDEHGAWNWVGQPRAEYETGVEMLYHCGVLRYAQRMPDLMMRKSALARIGGFVWSPKAWVTDHETAIALSIDKGAACARDVLFYWRESNENISLKYDDAEVKLRAHELHRQWIGKFLENTKPRTETDVQLLKFIRRDVGSTIDGLSKWVVRRLPDEEWSRMLKVGEMPDNVRNELGKELSRRRFFNSRFYRILRCFLFRPTDFFRSR